MPRLALTVLLALVAMPAFAIDRVTVDQLERELTGMKGKLDKEAAQRLGELELTERLSTARMEKLQADGPGEKTRLALLALGDASAFLGLPATDVVALPAPEPAIQGQIMSRAMDFVIATISRMPDFLATRTTTRFQDAKISPNAVEMKPGPNQAFGYEDKSVATVVYRNGREVVETAGANKSFDNTASTRGLTNWGVFGPILGVVMADVMKSKMGWSHWEEGPEGRLAVFRYFVPKDNSSYTVRYCCFVDSDGVMRDFQQVPQYHGEIAVNAKSGAVLRLVLKTDLEKTLPVTRADVMVEYNSVDIGGKRYICPKKSVSISTAVVVESHALAPRGEPVLKVAYKSKVSAINDAVFDNYHQFRTEMNILPPAQTSPH